ncbi:MAG: DUF1573 domain-containing protein [Candidatus Aminicenantales bacterium]|jgi:hypothetical protein
MFIHSRRFNLGAAAVAILVLASAGVAAKGSKIVFKEDAWNFGKSKGGEDLVHEFVFKNEGDAALHIKNVETSCGCTAALVSDQSVDPGKTGRIKITFSTRGYSGEVSRFVYVESDDPVSPRVQLKISAAVDVQPQPRIDLDRYGFEGGLFIEGDELVAPVTIFNKGELELRVEASLPGAKFLLNGKPAVFPVKIAAGRDLELTVKMSLANHMGPVREYVLLKSNDPMRATISVNLSGYSVTREQLKQIFQKYKDILK